LWWGEYDLKRVILIFTIAFQIVFATEVFTLASANKGGHYDRLALQLKSIIEKHTPFNIDVINTNGSTENIDGLLLKKYDMALVQSDILFKRIQKSEDITGKIAPIASFYKEPIYILTYRDDIVSIKDLIHRTVNVGQEGSGLKESAEYILTAADIIDDVQLLHLSPDEALSALIDKKVHAIFLNEITPKTERMLKEKRLFIVPISERFIKKLHKTLPFFEAYNHTIDKFACIPTISTRVMFVVRSDINENTVYLITESLHKVQNEAIKKIVRPSRLFEVNPFGTWHKGVEKYADRQHIALTKEDSFDLYWLYIITALLVGIVLFLAVGVLIVYYANIFHRFRTSHVFVKYSQRFYKWALKHKYKLIVLLLILFYVMCALLIKFLEHAWAIQNGKYSLFDSMNFWETFRWLFVFGSSGYSDQIFPESPIGKLVASLIPFIGISGIFAMVGLYIFDKIKQYIEEVNGMGTKKIKNHIIVCGWNHSAKHIVESLTHKNLSKKEQIVLLVSRDEYIEAIKSCEFDALYVSYIKGKATNRSDLDRVNLKDANRVIVLAEDNAEDSDASVILSILTIETYCKELKAQEEKAEKQDCIYTVAEIKHMENARLAYDAGADQVVSLGGIESKIFTQAIMNPGIAKFMHEIMTYNDQNDVYSFVVESDNPLIGKTFDEILALFRKHKVLLLSINTGFKKSKEEIEETVKKYDLDDPIITNPFKKSECDYKVRERDLLIVLAQYQSIVDEALEKITKGQ
jgi:voltage-gated potassium channel